MYEEKYPQTKHGGDRKSGTTVSSGHDVHLIPSFADDAAEKLVQVIYQLVCYDRAAFVVASLRGF